MKKKKEKKTMTIFEKTKDGKAGAVLDNGDATRLIETWGLDKRRTYAAISELERGAKKKTVSGYFIKEYVDVRPASEKDISQVFGCKDDNVLYLSDRKFKRYDENRRAKREEYEREHNPFLPISFEGKVAQYIEYFKKKYFSSPAEIEYNRRISDGASQSDIEQDADFIDMLEKSKGLWDIDEVMKEAVNDYLTNSRMSDFAAKAKLTAAYMIRDCEPPRWLPARRDFSA